MALLSAALTGHAVPAFAEPLGRLFLTPEQRGALDARRKARLPDKPAPVVMEPSTTRLDGYVKRSDGKSTIWVNGESLREGPQADAPRFEGADPGRVSIPLGDDGSRARLKPGETIEVGTKQVRDVMRGGEIRVRRGER